MNFLVPHRPKSVVVAPVAFNAEDERRANILRNHKPSYWTAAGLATATLHKLTRLHNGHVGALFDLRIVNPHTGKRESTRYLYGVDAIGAPKELKKLSTLVS